MICISTDGRPPQSAASLACARGGAIGGAEGGLFAPCERLRSKTMWTLAHPENRPCRYPVDMLRKTNRERTRGPSCGGGLSRGGSIVRNCCRRATSCGPYCCHDWFSRLGAGPARHLG